MILSVIVSSGASPSQILPAIQSLIKRIANTYSLYKKYQRCKALAKSLNHLIILLEKEVLKIPIKPNETEQDSYHDIKQAFQHNWPFMWSVDKTKDQKILVQGKFECFPFSSYAYLDMLRDPEVQEAAIQAARDYAPGNHGPRMLGGNMEILVELERVIAGFFGKEHAITCSSGYLACMSVTQALAHKGDIIFADQYCHASLRSGFKLSGAQIVYFKHNDYVDLEKKLKQFKKKCNKFLVIESVYSMDGNIGDLPNARRLADKFGLTLICDEAHGLGVIGRSGRGLEEYYDMPGACDIICGTFSKSLSSVGGYITGNRKTVHFMEFFAQGNMFSAPCSAYHAGAAIKSFEKILAEPQRVRDLHQKVKYFRKKLAEVHWDKDDLKRFEVYGVEDQPILPIVFQEDPTRVFKICTLLKEHGYVTGSVVAPACPLKTPRLRVTCTSA